MHVNLWKLWCLFSDAGIFVACDLLISMNELVAIQLPSKFTQNIKGPKRDGNDFVFRTPPFGEITIHLQGLWRENHNNRLSEAIYSSQVALSCNLILFFSEKVARRSLSTQSRSIQNGRISGLSLLRGAR